MTMNVNKLTSFAYYQSKFQDIKCYLAVIRKNQQNDLRVALAFIENDNIYISKRLTFDEIKDKQYNNYSKYRNNVLSALKYPINHKIFKIIINYNVIADTYYIQIYKKASINSVEYNIANIAVLNNKNKHKNKEYLYLKIMLTLNEKQKLKQQWQNEIQDKYKKILTDKIYEIETLKSEITQLKNNNIIDTGILAQTMTINSENEDTDSLLSIAEYNSSDLSPIPKKKRKL